MNTYQSQFPLLSQKVNGLPLVYFDNAATTPKPQSVIDAVSNYFKESNGNPGRGTHFLARKSAAIIEDVRLDIGKFLNISAEQTLVFTKNCTESINLAAHIIGVKHHAKSVKPTIVITQSEHHANYLPWVKLAESEGFGLVIVRVQPTGEIDYSALSDAITNASHAIVAITHTSNVTGLVTDINKVASLCEQHKATLLIDAAQALAHEPIDLQKTPCAYLAASAHKAYGPDGVGFLVLPKSDLEYAEPLLVGGGIVLKVEGITYELKDTEERFEAGTQNISGVAGFGAAIKFVKETSISAVIQQESTLVTHFLKVLNRKQLPIRLLAIPTHPIFSFISKVHPHDIADFLDENGIAVRAGNHCAQPLHQALGVVASTRVSLSFYNTTDEIDYLFDVLTACLKKYD